jgi:hypothetical protein
MHQSRCHQAWSNVNTLALSRPSFDGFLQPLQQDCMLLTEPCYLSYPARVKAVVARGPLWVQTLLPEAPPVVIHPQLAPDQLVL